MSDVATTDRRELRKFGLTMAGAIAVLGVLRCALHGFDHVPWVFLAVAAVFLGFGLAAPPVLRPVFVAWMKFTQAMNWVMTRIFLALTFYLLITPVRLIIRIFGEDPLKRAWGPEASTYWEEPEEQPREFDRYRQQF